MIIKLLEDDPYLSGDAIIEYCRRWDSVMHVPPDHD